MQSVRLHGSKGDDSGDTPAVVTDADGHLQVDVVSAASLSLPSGAATSAKQDDAKAVLDTIDTVLDTIEGRTPAKGQSTKAGSVPVVLPSDMGDLAVTLDSEAVVLGAGTEVIGRVGIDQTTANANEIEIKNIQVALSANFDSVDVAKKSKGGITVAHDTIANTATSAEIDCRGFNCLLVCVGPFSAAENWTFKVQGCMVSGGTFVDWYELANTGAMAVMSHQCSVARGFTFRGIPDYLKIVATRDGGPSTVSVNVQPFNG